LKLQTLRPDVTEPADFPDVAAGFVAQRDGGSDCGFDCRAWLVPQPAENTASGTQAAAIRLFRRHGPRAVMPAPFAAHIFPVPSRANAARLRYCCQRMRIKRRKTRVQALHVDAD
jgi:hypothetical protein